MITIVDYKVGNLGSISNMLKKIGSPSIITSNKEEIRKAEKLILPGVGAFDSGITSLKKLDLWDVLNEKVLEEKVPVLGICLGMQLLCNSSEEGIEKGLGWIDAKVKKFRFDETKFKVPHMGWNYTNSQKQSLLTQDLPENPKFYFVHSYYVQTEDNSAILRTEYNFPFDSAVEKDNILGVQFHPEKSHKYGMKLLDNFIKRY